MPASLEGQLVVAISSRALFDFEEENQHFEANDDRAYMQLQLERIDAGGQARRRVLAGAKAPRLQRRVDAAGRGRDPVAQRPGLGHARVPLGAGLRHADPARRVHARRVALALPEAARRQPVPLDQRGRRALGARGRRAGGARLSALGARLRRASARSAHRLRRRRRALLRRGRARLPEERPRRLPGARARPGRDAAGRRPVQAAAAGAAAAAARAGARHAHPHRARHRAQRAGARARRSAR